MPISALCCKLLNRTSRLGAKNTENYSNYIISPDKIARLRQRPSSVGEAPEFWCKRAQSRNLFRAMPSAAQNAPRELIRLKAVKGRVIDRSRVHRDSVEAYSSLDTVAYHQPAVEASTEHTATTRLYNPPDGTAAVIITILVIGCLIYVFYRKR